MILISAVLLFTLVQCADDSGNSDLFGFIVCSQTTDTNLEANIVSISEPMGEPDILVAVEGHSAIDPVVTPDGTTLVFSANFENDNPTGNDPPGGCLYRMDLTTKNYTRITDDDWMSLYERAPAISPDGTTIIYTRAYSAPDYFLSNIDRLWMVQLDGSDNHPVFDDEILRNDYSPAFSPDGSKLAYLSDNGGNVNDIMVYDLESEEGAVNLTNSSSFLDSPASPFFDASGQWIYYYLTSIDLSEYSLNRISITGGVPEKILDIPSADPTDISNAPAYNEFKPTKDFRHFVLTGLVNDVHQVFTADTLSEPFSPEAVTDASHHCFFPFWHRP